MPGTRPMPEYALPLFAFGLAFAALIVGGALSLVLWWLLGARLPAVEEVDGHRLYHRSRLRREVNPSQVWIRLERTLTAGWIARSWLLGAFALGLGAAAYLLHQHQYEWALVAAVGGVVFLPAAITVWDEGRDVYIIADRGQGVVFRKEVRGFRRRPAEAYLLRDLRTVVLRQETPPAKRPGGRTGIEEFDEMAQELWRVPLNWILEIARRSEPALHLLTALNYRFMHDCAVALSEATGLPMEETEAPGEGATPAEGIR